MKNMRRGHPSFGGWRNENHRNFRPRTGGAPRFRPPRPYSLLDGPRFTSPGPRSHNRGSHPYNTHPTHADEQGLPDYQERNKYRKINHHHQSNQRLSDKNHHQKPRNLYSYFSSNLDKKDNTQYKHSQNFYQDVTPESFHINSLGDVDQRQLAQPHRINPWTNPPPPDQRQFYEDRDPYRTKNHDIEHHTIDANKAPVIDYTGHRPPSSDYYGSTSGATVNNNDTSFSRSVDDTVDIVRKRLLYRNEPQNNVPEHSVNQICSEEDRNEHRHQHAQQEQAPRKKTQRQKHNVKANCDKMKSNIVHQLFKMDKDKMHKLMDDPGSSTKFEYAISSLITESQNSLNRHLRSVAEKSLVNSDTDFIHNDNNTIYEDTFMKQMQCILDPQDTVLLEDIKPLVMAELSKVLQMEDVDWRYDADYPNSYPVNTEPDYPIYEDYNYDEFPQEKLYDEDLRVLPNYEDHNIPVTDCGPSNQFNINEQQHPVNGPIFDRQPSMTKDTREIDLNQDRRYSTESQRQRRSVDQPTGEQFCANNETYPLFSTNLDQTSEDDDTFAELDKQYHVPVDHNFLDDVSARTTPTYMQSSSNSTNIKKELDGQLHSLTDSLILAKSVESNVENQMRPVDVKQEIIQSPDFPKENSTPTNSSNLVQKIDTNINQQETPRYNETNKEINRCDNLNKDKTFQSNSRKRSIDQRPSHRKEKRKKSESTSTNTVQSSHKQDISKDKEKHSDGLKSQNVLTSNVSSKKLSKDDKKHSTAQRSYSDKYVKRKEDQSKKHETHKKRNSSSSNQNILSPNDSNSSSVTPTKCDSKPKFKTIDMFMEQPKKLSVHQAHRNTAPCVTEDPKSKQVVTPLNKVVQTKHVSTQVFKRAINKETQTFIMKKICNKFSQTEKVKLLSKGIQTSLMPLDKAKPKAQDAFERMKEIDMEIQELLQEKFKLYNNLESRETGSIIENLGMTVLNVTPITHNEDDNIIEQETADSNTFEVTNDIDVESSMSGDAIVNEFTNIPVEQLEQIALESVDVTDIGPVNKSSRRYTRQKKLQKDRLDSASPSSTSSRKSKKKEKTPMISLIEQIITDDRPIEDIISLDVLETPPKSKKKSTAKPKKKLAKKIKAANSVDTNPYGLKPCSVVLVKTDFAELLRSHPDLKITFETTSTTVDSVINLFSSEGMNEPVILDNEALEHFEVPLEPNYLTHDKSLEAKEAVEENVNDLQFDMLDVSEDIVIGDSCETKDKDSGDHVVTITEDLILDNSQSSVDDVYGAVADKSEIECKMFDYSTDEELRRDTLTVTGNADAVLAIECIENGFLAACLDGNVYHFSGDGQLLNTMRGSNLAVTCLTIVKEKYGTTVYTGSLDSRIRYYELETGLEKGPECNVLSPIQTMDRAWDTVFVGTRTGFVLQFECKNNMLIPVSTVKFSEQAILALRAMKEGPRKVLLVASRSENVTIKDAQTGLLLRTLAGPKMTVYSLLFEDGKVYCGTSSHQIHVFDYASGGHTYSHEGGKGAVCLRAAGGLLFAGCYDGCVYVYREGAARPLAQFRGPSLMLLSLAVLGGKIIAGYKDRSLYMWKIPLCILDEMIL